jgi:chemotaxis protein methyltransferase CheR
LRQNKINSFHDYVKKLKTDQGFYQSEVPEIINRMTTNKTDFFRENHHFEYLKKVQLPAIEEKYKTNIKKSLRIWCSASSTGEEPYSIGITVYDYFQGKPGWDIKIYASDIDTNVLQHADKGLYKEDRFVAMPKDIMNKHFIPMKTNEGQEYRIKPHVRELITFKKVNLLDPTYPFIEKMDIIFCRNVIIYFDKPTQKTIFSKMEKIMVDEGLLIIGHSETLFGITENFKFLGHTIYQKKPNDQLK